MNEKRKSTDAISDMNQMLELSGKDFKPDIIKMCLHAIANYFKQEIKNERNPSIEIEAILKKDPNGN